MTNAWNITEREYEFALAVSRDGRTPPDVSADFWQLCRFYRGQVFDGEAAKRAARLVRAFLQPSAGE